MSLFGTIVAKTQVASSVPFDNTVTGLTTAENVQDVIDELLSGGSSGITELTGDVTAGPGSGSQVAILSATGVTPGSYTFSSITVDAKGRITAASSGSPSGLTFPIDVPFSATPNIRGDSDTGFAFPSDGLFDFFNNSVKTVSFAPGGIEFFVPITVTDVVYPAKNNNTFLAGPVSGGPSVPSFRLIQQGDIPASAVPYPLIVPQGPTIQIRDDGDGDTGIRFTSDGILDIFANSVNVVHITPSGADITGDLDVTGNISAANFPPVYTVKHMLYADPTTGEITEWSGAEVNADFGWAMYTAPDLATSTVTTLFNQEYALESTADTSDGRRMFFWDMHYDRNGTNFDINASVTQFAAQMRHEGGGHVNYLEQLSFTQTLGSGGSTATTDDMRMLNLNQNIDTNAIADQLEALVYVLNGDGEITGNTTLLGLYSNDIQIGGNLDTININHSPIDVAGSLRGFTMFASNGTIGDQFQGIQLGISADVGSFTTLFYGNMSGDVGATFTGLDIEVGDNTISGNFNGAVINAGNNTVISDSGTWLGLYSANTATVGNGVNVINIGFEADVTGDANFFNGYYNGDATGNSRAFNFNFANGTSADRHIGMQLSFGGSPTTAIQGININGTGTSAEVTGVSVDLSSMTRTDGQRKQGLGINDGVVFINSNLSTVSSFPNIVDFGNFWLSTFTVANGSPITGTEFMSNLIVGNSNFSDDYSAGLIGFGMTASGVINQIAVDSGKTADIVSTQILGATIPFNSTGGTVTHAINLQLGGLINFGGSLVTTNLYGIKDAAAFVAGGATNTWGFHLQSDVYNWLGGSLKIGGSVGSTDRVTNSDIALEVEGGAFVLPSFDTAGRNALTAIAGMMIFNTDTSGPEYYDGTVWVAL